MSKIIPRGGRDVGQCIAAVKRVIQMGEKPFQYSLSALFAVLTFLNFLFGYIAFVGIWKFVLAIVPPLTLAAVMNILMSPGSWWNPRPSKDLQEDFQSWQRQWNDNFSPAVRVLISLILGYLIWLPVMLFLCFG